MKKNRIITFVLTLIMLFNILSFSAYGAEGTLTVPVYFSELYPNVGAKTPVRPVHKYIYRQNPPVFLWPVIENADSYDIKVCADEEMTEVLYEIKGLTDNYYHFEEAFETGEYYWWAYRYNKNSKSSDWCVARRFKVASDATEIILPTAKEIIAKTGGESPSLYFSSKTIPELKDKVQNNAYVKKYFKEYLLPLADRYVSGGITILKPPLDVTTVSEDELQSFKQTAYTAYWGLCNASRIASIAYHITDDTKYAEYAKDCLMEVSTWDWASENSALAFHHYDTFYMRSLRYYGLAYDWIRSYMTEEERKQVSADIYAKVMNKWDYVSATIKKYPYASHEWTGLQSFGCSLMAVLNDIPEARPAFDDFVEVLMAVYLPFSIEDGGYSMGMNYWAASTDLDYPFMQAMTYAGIYDFYELPYNKNCYLWCLYMYPTPGAHFGSWGDSGDFNYPKDWLVQGAQHFGLLADRDELLWWKQKIGTSWEYGSVEGIFYVESDLMGRAPIEYPRDWHFKDQGMTAMHSDLINEPRISATFRSGMFGNYNHTHADINSFMIESNGKPLAWRSGYYGSWNSDHHRYFSRAAHAHNTITYDNGIGQPNEAYDFDADGVTTMYLSNTDMAVAVGDGKEAYVGGLDKFDRTFIYLRPDSYIVVDNLKASEKKIASNGGSTFEWWLNSIGTLDFHSDNKGARITYDGEVLDARIQYPENITHYYSKLFAGPDGVEYLPHQSLTNWSRHHRVWFKTEKLPETKIIATMSVGSTKAKGEDVKVTKSSNYMKLEFEGGEVAYISTLTDETQLISADNFRFNGTAVVVDDDHIMFIGGTKLYIDGKLTIDADRPVAVTMGADELGVSSGDDYNITLYYNSYMPSVDSIRFRNDDNPVEIGMGIKTTVDLENNALKIQADKGHYSLLLNEKPLPGDKLEGEWNYTLIVDGNTQEHTTDYLYYCDADYNIAGAGHINSTLLKEKTQYHVSAVNGNITYMGKTLSSGDRIIYSSEEEFIFAEEDCSLSFESYENTDVTFEKITASYVEFTKDDLENTLTARARITNNSDEPTSARIILAAFDNEDRFLTAIEESPLIVNAMSETYYEAVLKNPPQNAENYKAFLWKGSSLTPFVQCADSSAEAELKGIWINGVEIKDFDASRTTYDYAIYDDIPVLPVVKGITSDNGVYAATSYTMSDNKKTAVATISVYNLFKSQDAQKEYTVNISIGPKAVEGEDGIAVDLNGTTISAHPDTPYGYDSDGSTLLYNGYSSAPVASEYQGSGYLYTNLHGIQDKDNPAFWGSMLYTNLRPTRGRKFIFHVDTMFEGSQFFPFTSSGIGALSEGQNILKFNVNSPCKVSIITASPNYSFDGFTYESIPDAIMAAETWYNGSDQASIYSYITDIDANDPYVTHNTDVPFGMLWDMFSKNPNRLNWDEYYNKWFKDNTTTSSADLKLAFENKFAFNTKNGVEDFNEGCTDAMILLNSYDHVYSKVFQAGEVVVPRESNGKAIGCPIVVITPIAKDSQEILDHVSDFKTYFDNFRSDTYGGKVYLNYGGEEQRDVTEEYSTVFPDNYIWEMTPVYRITPYDGVRDWFDRHTGIPAFYKNVDRVSGLEGSLYIRQSAMVNVGAAGNISWTPENIQKLAFVEAAFHGSLAANYSGPTPDKNRVVLEYYDCRNLGDKLWASFKVNKDCDVIIVNRHKDYPPNFVVDEKYGWKEVTSNATDIIEICRSDASFDPMGPVSDKYYIKSFKAGDTVELYNANNNLPQMMADNVTPGYHVFVRVK